MQAKGEEAPSRRKAEEEPSQRPSKRPRSDPAEVRSCVGPLNMCLAAVTCHLQATALLMCTAQQSNLADIYCPAVGQNL